MDSFEGLLRTMHVECSLYVRLQLGAPYGFSFRVDDEPRLVVVTHGGSWLASDVLPAPVWLSAGDSFLVRPGVRFALKDEVDRAEVRVTCGPTFSENGRVVRCGGQGADVEVISSRFSASTTAAEPIFVLMPPIARARLQDTHASLMQATLKVIELEAVEDRVGGALVMNRLLDVLFIQTVRGWFASEDARAEGWLDGPRDPRIAAAIREMHDDLARAWTVETLAKRAGMSRSSFAALFKQATGKTPLEYLTAWRICRSKGLLRSSELSVSEIAERVGYDTDMALIRAFKRSVGVPPGEWRRESRARLPA